MTTEFDLLGSVPKRWLTCRQVEGVLFKVPRFKFERSSSVFSDMFAIPAEDSQEGSSDDKPIRLELIEQVDFQRFLSAMFPECVRFVSSGLNKAKKTHHYNAVTPWSR